MLAREPPSKVAFTLAGFNTFVSTCFKISQPTPQSDTAPYNQFQPA
jgi:hypothetical protein